MVFVVQTGNGDLIERMWRLMVSARGNAHQPQLWRLTEEVIDLVQAFYRLGEPEEAAAPGQRESLSPTTISRFLDIPVDPTTTRPHLLCRPDVVYPLL
jgi:hypothetical protein